MVASAWLGAWLGTGVGAWLGTRVPAFESVGGVARHPVGSREVRRRDGHVGDVPDGSARDGSARTRHVALGLGPAEVLRAALGGPVDRHAAGVEALADPAEGRPPDQLLQHPLDPARRGRKQGPHPRRVLRQRGDRPDRRHRIRRRGQAQPGQDTLEPGG